MNSFSRLVYELEDYARQNGGRFWLLDVKHRHREPPNGSVYVVVDFEHGSMQASVFVDIVCKRHRYPYRMSQAADLTEEFKQTVLPNAMILSGPPPMSPDDAERQLDERMRRLLDE